MVFSSIIFTYLFLPIVIILYFLCKGQARNYLLLVASLLFYSYGEPKFVFVMIGSIILNYLMAILISKDSARKKLWMLLAVIINIGLLYVCKYLDFSITIFNSITHKEMPLTNIALPIGISFFTFQALSYVIDVYRGNVEVQKNPFYVALYISFFPQLIAGPIVRYSTIENQILHRESSVEMVAAGCKRFMLGFAKKVILANNLAVVASEMFAVDVKNTPTLILWLCSICYSLQIFFDFSGYSDMAIGLGKIFGFSFEENFNYPYISKSITDFWRRWHISLSGWFRDYVYIPLGGNRCSTSRVIFNLFIVWLLTGIWHGANYTFIAWGLGYFVMLILEKYIVKPEQRKNILIRIVWQIITLLCVNFAWVIFDFDTIRNGARYCAAMVGAFGLDFSVTVALKRYIREFGVYIVAGILFSTPIAKIIGEKLENNEKLAVVGAVVTPIVYGLIFLWAVSFLILGAHNPFIYFSF